MGREGSSLELMHLCPISEWSNPALHSPGWKSLLISPLVPGQRDRLFTCGAGAADGAGFGRRGDPAVLRWLCCRASLFADAFGCVRGHRASEAYVEDSHWKGKEKKQRFLSAGSISVLADTFKLGHEVIYNYQQSPGARWSGEYQWGCCLPPGSVQVLHTGEDRKIVDLQYRLEMLFVWWWEILFLPKWCMCYCQSRDVKLGWFGYWEIPAVIWRLLAFVWVSEFFTETNAKSLSCCLCQRELDVFLTVIFS